MSVIKKPIHLSLAPAQKPIPVRKSTSSAQQQPRPQRVEARTEAQDRGRENGGAHGSQDQRDVAVVVLPFILSLLKIAPGTGVFEPGREIHGVAIRWVVKPSDGSQHREKRHGRKREKVNRAQNTRVWRVRTSGMGELGHGR